MDVKPAVATRLRGIWLSSTDISRSRSFYEQLGAHFDDAEPADGIVNATLGGTRLIFEPGHGTPPGTGPFLLFDVTDADALHAELNEAGCAVEGAPKDEPWGRQFNVQDPDGYSIAFDRPGSITNLAGRTSPRTRTRLVPGNRSSSRTVCHAPAGLTSGPKEGFIGTLVARRVAIRPMTRSLESARFSSCFP